MAFLIVLAMALLDMSRGPLLHMLPQLPIASPVSATLPAIARALWTQAMVQPVVPALLPGVVAKAPMSSFMLARALAMLKTVFLPFIKVTLLVLLSTTLTLPVARGRLLQIPLVAGDPKATPWGRIRSALRATLLTAQSVAMLWLEVPMTSQLATWPGTARPVPAMSFLTAILRALLFRRSLLEMAKLSLARGPLLQAPLVSPVPTPRVGRHPATTSLLGTPLMVQPSAMLVLEVLWTRVVLAKQFVQALVLRFLVPQARSL